MDGGTGGGVVWCVWWVCVVIKGLRHDDIQYTTLLLWVLYYYGILYIYRSTCWALSLVCFVYVVLSLYYSRVVGNGRF